MGNVYFSWSLGFLFSLGLGWFFTGVLHKGLRWYLNSEQPPEPHIAPWFVGMIERFIFTAFVGLVGASMVPAMIGWIAIKMAANWNRGRTNDKRSMSEETVRALAISTLLVNLVSMFFSLVGGLICRLKL